jgi:hypothetical protein
MQDKIMYLVKLFEIKFVSIPISQTTRYISITVPKRLSVFREKNRCLF